MKTKRLWGLLLFSFMLVGGCLGENYQRLLHERNWPTEIANSTRVGNEACQQCHGTIRGKKATRYHSDCEGCHGGGSVHKQAEKKQGTIAFPDDKICMDCHRTGNNTTITWNTSQHKRAGIMCFQCHRLHDKTKFLLDEKPNIRFQKMNRITTLCTSCHQEMLAKINMPSHHPLKEGELTCADCHDPHADRRLALSGNNGVCFRCHQNKQGPWVFEHAPVTEDCANCHDPHGSVNAHLMTLSQPVLCLQCHSIPNNRHGGSGGIPIPANYLKRCTNCHGAIHGSHQDRLLKQ